MSLEDYDYDIPETLSIEDLLKDMIKRLKLTNEKINLLAFCVSQDLRYLPPGIFTEDDKDTKE